MTLQSGIALVILLIAPVARAQIPAVSLDLLVGAGPHNSRPGGNEYESQHEPTARFAVTVRLGTSGRNRPVLKAEYVLTPPADEISFGYPSDPISYPGTRGAGLALGAQHVTSSRAIVGIAVGRGRYGGNYYASRYNATFVEGEAAMPIGVHAAFMLNAQYKTWANDDAHHWYLPLTIGMRIQ